MDKPLLSILMTAYNREGFISEAIESALSSSLVNFELIILDDASTDNTFKIASEFENLDKRIRLYRNENNLGQFATRNKIVSFATAEYIMWLDSDDKTFDFSFKYCLDEMLEDKHADIGMLCFHPALFGKVLSPQESIQYHFNQKQFLTVGPGGTILKKSFFNKIGGFSEKYGPANDMYFNLKAASFGNLKCLEKVFLFYREHDGQERNNPASYVSNGYLYMNDSLTDLPLTLTEKEKSFFSRKNKRRFIVNTFKYFLKYKSFAKIFAIIKNAKFSFKDLLQGIFN